MTKDEALRLALEALEYFTDTSSSAMDKAMAEDAITAIKAALANEALERKAENARELGLDYEPVETETVTAEQHDRNLHAKYKQDMKSRNWISFNEWLLETTPPQQEAKDEPVAWISPTELLVMRGNALGGAKDWRVNVGLKPEDGDVGLYTTPPQRTWVGLTDMEIDQGLCRTNYAMQTAGAWRDGVEWAIKQLQERNS
jgi:hypothetical protein